MRELFKWGAVIEGTLINVIVLKLSAYTILVIFTAYSKKLQSMGSQSMGSETEVSPRNNQIKN
jgi:hypothetical protein